MDVQNTLRVNQPVNYRTCDFLVESINEDGSITLKPTDKYLNSYTVEQHKVHLIEDGFYRSSRKLSKGRR